MIQEGSSGFYGRWGEDHPGWCPNCKTDSALAIRDRRRIWPEITDNLVRPKSACVFEIVYSCRRCKQTVVVFEIFAELHGSGAAAIVAARRGDAEAAPTEVILAWPRRPSRELHASAPEAIRALYEEASIAEGAGALRGAAALYRASVEELCVDFGATGKDLKTRINNLTTKDIDKTIIDDLHEARILGNWSLHEGLMFSASEVGDVAALIEEAVQVLYVQPAERLALRDARQARIDAAKRHPSD